VSQTVPTAPVGATGAAAPTGGGARRTPGGAVAGAPERRPGREHRPLWLMLPGGVLLAVVVLVPLGLAVWLSLTQLTQYTLRQWVSAPFIGVQNYVDAVTTGPLLHSVWLSVAFSVLTTVITIPIGLVAACAAHDRFRGRAVVRSVFLIPYVLPTFVVGTVWGIALGPNGAVNSVLAHVGVNGGNWLIGGRSFWTLVLIDTWAAWPFIYLLSLAGLQSIGREVHEAASVDGATWWQKLVHIILPSLRGPLALALVIGTLHHLNNFTLPFLLFGSPAPDEVNVLPVAIYSTSFQTFQFGLSSAMSVVSLVLVLIPLLVYLRAVRLDTGLDKGAQA
jgi:multiple sugar transport system permease protein